MSDIIKPGYDRKVIFPLGCVIFIGDVYMSGYENCYDIKLWNGDIITISSIRHDAHPQYRCEEDLDVGEIREIFEREREELIEHWEEYLERNK